MLKVRVLEDNHFVPRQPIDKLASLRVAQRAERLETIGDLIPAIAAIMILGFVLVTLYVGLR